MSGVLAAVCLRVTLQLCLSITAVPPSSRKPPPSTGLWWYCRTGVCFKREQENEYSRKGKRCLVKNVQKCNYHLCKLKNSPSLCYQLAFACLYVHVPTSVPAGAKRQQDCLYVCLCASSTAYQEAVAVCSWLDEIS